MIHLVQVSRSFALISLDFILSSRSQDRVELVLERGLGIGFSLLPLERL